MIFQRKERVGDITDGGRVIDRVSDRQKKRLTDCEAKTDRGGGGRETERGSEKKRRRDRERDRDKETERQRERGEG